MTTEETVGLREIVLFGASAEVAQAVRANAGGRTVVVTTTRDELMASLARAPAVLVFDSRDSDPEIAQEVAGLMSAVLSPLILVTGCRRAETRTIHRLCIARPDARVDLDGAEVTRLVSRLDAEPLRPTAAAAIIGAVSGELPGLLGAYRVVSAILSRRRVTVDEICRRCECSPSHVDHLARACGVPGPGQQNREHWALHVLHDSAVTGMPLKQIVAAHGGGSASAHSHRVKGALGKPLRAWRYAGGFDGALAGYASRWHTVE